MTDLADQLTEQQAIDVFREEEMPELQHRAFEHRYGDSADADWAYHDDPDPATRLQSDRMLDRGIDRLLELTGAQPEDLSVLVVCGGVGGEATQLRKRGFTRITNSDFSTEAIEIAKRREPTIESVVLNAEALDVPDGHYDLVVVQAGLHHLPRPVLGLNEMVRAAGKAVLVIEPNEGVLAKILGQEFEIQGGEVNYVFRWTEALLEQAVKSQVLQDPVHIENVRTLHHHKVWTVSEKLFRGNRKLMYLFIRGVYAIGGPLLDRVGNMFIGIVVRDPHLGTVTPVVRLQRR